MQVIVQIFVGFPVSVIAGMLGTKLYTIITVNNENREHAEFCWKIGNVYLQQGALDHAIDEYGQAIKFYPGYAQAFHDRGLAHLKQGENDLAIADLGEAIRLAPNGAEQFKAIAFSNRGDAHASKRNWDRAISDYSAAIALNPNVAEVLLRRGIAHISKGQARPKIGEHELAIQDFDAAIKDLDEAIRLDPNGAEAFIAFYNRGFAYACKGEYDQAIRDYSCAITLNPNFAEAFHGLGVAYNEKREYHRAIRNFDEAIEIKPGYAIAFYNRAFAYWHLGLHAPPAIKDVNKAIKLDSNLAEAFELRSLAKRMVGDLKGAEADAARAKQIRRRP